MNSGVSEPPLKQAVEVTAWRAPTRTTQTSWALCFLDRRADVSVGVAGLRRKFEEFVLGEEPRGGEGLEVVGAEVERDASSGAGHSQRSSKLRL